MEPCSTSHRNRLGCWQDANFRELLEYHEVCMIDYATTRIEVFHWLPSSIHPHSFDSRLTTSVLGSTLSQNSCRVTLELFFAAESDPGIRMVANQICFQNISKSREIVRIIT